MTKFVLLIYKLFFKNFINSDTKIIGFFFKEMRNICFKIYTKSKSKHINIQRGASFAEDTVLGDYSGIGENCLVTRNVIIGRYVMMGPNVKIYTINHRFDDLTKPMCFQGFKESKKVIIKDDVWIGANVIILPGVIIGKGAVIGAGSVISKNVDDYSVMIGNPAIKVKSRGD